MHAITIQQPGGPEVLRLESRPRPQPAAHEVLVRVRAAGVNRPDVLMRQGKYAGSGEVAGLVPGLEIAGTIEACGADVTRWQPGDAVCALLPAGGYAEFAAVDARHCLPVPPGLSLTEAAALPETIFTVWHNVFQRGSLQPGEMLLVHGGSLRHQLQHRLVVDGVYFGKSPIGAGHRSGQYGWCEIANERKPGMQTLL